MTLALVESVSLVALVVLTNVLSFSVGVYSARNGREAAEQRMRDRIEGGVFALDHIWRCLTDHGKALMGPLLLAMMKDYRGIVHRKLGAQLRQSDVEAQAEAETEPRDAGKVH